MASFGIKLAGTELLVQRLTQLDGQAKTLVTQALRRSSSAVVSLIIPLVPKKTGALAAAQGFAIRKPKQGSQYAVIGARRGIQSAAVKKAAAAGVKIEPANYAHLVDRGTRPHAIRVAVTRGGVRRKWQWMHPGAKAQPFMEPAAAAAGPIVISQVKADLEKAIKEAERLY